jgi:hypothetical protein
MRSASANAAASGSTRNSSRKASAMPISVRRTQGVSVVAPRRMVNVLMSHPIGGAASPGAH